MEKEDQYCYKYPRPAVTTDTVVFGFEKGELKVLLIERGNEPYKGSWALPGGFMEMDENAETCARRELAEETGLEEVYVEQLYTFSAVDRDPRYRVVSIVYCAFVRLSDCKAEAGDDARQAQWFSLSNLPSLAFDHQQIVRMAVDDLKKKIRYQPIVFELLPEQFTFSDLQRFYEAVFQTTYDRRNFRKKIWGTGLLIDITECEKKEVISGRVRYYRFDKVKYQALLEQGYELCLI